MKGKERKKEIERGDGRRRWKNEMEKENGRRKWKEQMEG
jgi:hypothetical protein